MQLQVILVYCIELCNRYSSCRTCCILPVMPLKSTWNKAEK